MTPLQLVLVAALLSCCSALKDVVLDIPPVARVGSTVTLRCLYDLEDDKLYAVKWYRGNFEFYRATPNEKPSKQAFAYPDINVDMNLSDEHRVTLRRVPIHMSGNFSCEVSIDAPAFTTVFKSGQLKVLDTVRRPLLTVSKDLYLPGDELEANCTASPEPEEPQPPQPSLGHGGGGMLHGLHLPPLLEQRPPLQPHQLTPEQRAHLRKGAGQAAMTFGFWVNNRPVPAALVEQAAFSAIMLRPVAESDFSASGEMRLKCVVTFADKYREPSHVVTVRRQDTVEESPVVVDTPAVVAAELPEAADRSSTAGAGAVRFPVPAAALVSVLTLLLLSDGRL